MSMAHGFYDIVQPKLFKRVSTINLQYKFTAAIVGKTLMVNIQNILSVKLKSHDELTHKLTHWVFCSFLSQNKGDVKLST